MKWEAMAIVSSSIPSSPDARDLFQTANVLTGGLVGWDPI